jgi:FdhD protein
VRRYDVARRSWGNAIAARDLTNPMAIPGVAPAPREEVEFDLEPALDELPKEHTVTVEINGRPVATLLCSAGDLRELGAGWVFGHGFARTPDEVRSVTVKANRVSVMIDAPGPGGAAWQALVTAGFDAAAVRVGDLDELGLVAYQKKGDGSDWTISRSTFLKLLNYVFDRFRKDCSTGGIHHSASIDDEGRVVIMRDLNRHCAVDKAIGKSVVTRAYGEARMLLLSGRVSADIMLKAWRAGYLVVATRSLPSAEAIRIANAAGITVAGRVLDGRRSLYSNCWRIESTSDRFTA